MCNSPWRFTGFMLPSHCLFAYIWITCKVWDNLKTFQTWAEVSIITIDQICCVMIRSSASRIGSVRNVSSKGRYKTSRLQSRKRCKGSAEKRIKGEDLRFFQLHAMQNGAARFTVQKWLTTPNSRNTWRGTSNVFANLNSTLQPQYVALVVHFRTVRVVDRLGFKHITYD